MGQCSGMSLERASKRARGSAPRCRETLAVLDAVDIIQPLVERLLEVWAVSLRSASFAGQRPFATFKNGHRRQGGGLSGRSRFAVHVEEAGEPPYPDHVVVREIEGRKVELILAEGPELFCEGPPVDGDEGHARSSCSQQRERIAESTTHTTLLPFSSQSRHPSDWASVQECHLRRPTDLAPSWSASWCRSAWHARCRPARPIHGSSAIAPHFGQMTASTSARDVTFLASTRRVWRSATPPWASVRECPSRAVARPT